VQTKLLPESVLSITTREFLNRDSDAVDVTSKALVPEYLRAHIGGLIFTLKRAHRLSEA